LTYEEEESVTVRPPDEFQDQDNSLIDANDNFFFDHVSPPSFQVEDDEEDDDDIDDFLSEEDEGQDGQDDDLLSEEEDRQDDDLLSEEDDGDLEEKDEDERVQVTARDENVQEVATKRSNIKTSREKPCRVFQGYEYIKDKVVTSKKTSVERWYWKCREQHNGCLGRCISNGEFGEPDSFKPHNDFIHLAEDDLHNAREFEHNLLAAAVSSEEAPRSIMNRLLTSLDMKSASQVPNNANLAKKMRRRRKKLQHFAQDPENAGDLVIAEELQKSISGEQFIHYNERSDNTICMTTNSNLAILRKVTMWTMDGTFAVAPKLFTQLFTIGCIMNGFFLPLIYFLLPDKTMESYNVAFEMLTGFGLNPKSIGCDFEAAIIGSAQEHFPQVSIWCCWFHLAQNLL
jgi:hypothetical protein